MRGALDPTVSRRHHPGTRGLSGSSEAALPVVVQTGDGSDGTVMVGLLHRYRNRDVVTRIRQVLAGQDRDRPSDRTVQSVRRQNRLTPDRVRELVAQRNRGVEINELAEQFRVNRDTVINHLKQAGVTGRRWPGRTLDLRQLEEAGRLYESGMNVVAVGERFGVDRRYLRRALPEAGFMLRPPGRQRRQE